MRTRTARFTALAVVAAAGTLAVSQAALATTATGHQDPHLKVVSTLAPTKLHLGGTLHATVTVTNTSSTPRKVSISWEYDTPNSGEAAIMSPITIKPNATWTHKFSKTASEAGKYKLIIQASEGKAASKTSKATATASAA
jgi:hypothetical protein